jgi:hypothetical protein
MLHQVQFCEARTLIIPIGKGANRDLRFEQGAWLGSTAPTSDHAAFGMPKAIHGRGTDGFESIETRGTDLQVMALPQMVEFHSHGDAQTFRTNLIEEFREPQDRALAFGEIHASAWMRDWNLGITVAAFAAQQGNGMLAVDSP